MVVLDRFGQAGQAKRHSVPATRRRVLAGFGLGLAPLVLQACGGQQAAPTNSGAPASGAAGSAAIPATAAVAPTPYKSKDPVTIEVLTRTGVTNASGHSAWYAYTTC